MRRIILLFLVAIGTSVSTHPATAQDGDWESVNGEARKKIRERDLIKAYPVGKSWKTSKVLRAQGITKNTDWGFNHEANVIYTNRYASEITVRENELGEVKLRIFVLDMSQQRIVSLQKLKVADFSSSSPILSFAINKVLPSLGPAGPVMVMLERIDPQFEKTLTRILNYTQIDLSKLGKNTPISFIEDIEPLAGCTFEFIWTNGMGVTSVRQIGNTPVRVTLDEVREWAQSCDPLFDLYILPTANKKPGERWEVDGKHAVNVFSAQGASNSRGGLQLKYLRDSVYDGKTCRQLAIQGGTLGVNLDRGNREMTATASDIQGQIHFDKTQLLVLEANGTCHLDGEEKLKNHLLFDAKWQRDVDVEFRYEAKVIKK